VLVWIAVAGVAGAGCDRCDRSPASARREDARPAPPSADWADAARERMVAEQIEARGISDARVLAAMREVPRHEFVPDARREQAYEDHPVPIGHDQAMTQPYLVAKLAELAALDERSRVLEVGTGSGYTAAVLSRMAADVYTIEIIEPLARRAQQTLLRLGYQNVHARAGDGYAGWPDAAPFDVILVAAAPEAIPEPLRQQLRVGGRLVIPVGGDLQQLRVITRTETGFDERVEFPVRFVPMQRGDGG
jgi:protein-L-isoaspartate(D-aspartate) O-methyltransferase